jgi:hypothetical protein
MNSARSHGVRLSQRREKPAQRPRTSKIGPITIVVTLLVISQEGQPEFQR